MRRGPRVVLFLVALVAAAAVPWLISNQFYLLLLELVGVGAIVVLGLNLVLGYAGQVSLGHAALFGVGAYAAALLALRFDAPFPVGAVGAIAAAASVGVLLGVPSLRLSGAYLAMATMAFNLIAQRLAVNLVDLTGGPDGLTAIPPARLGPIVLDRRMHWYLILACGVGVYWLSANVIASRWGRALLAVREDELAAGASGVPVYRTKLTVFAVSAAFAGLGGALFAHLYRYVSPISFGLEASIEFLLAVLIGGPGRLVWPVVGVAIVTVVPQLPVLQRLQDYRLLVYGGLLLASVVVFRDGIGGWVARSKVKGAGQVGQVGQGGHVGQVVRETESEHLPPALGEGAGWSAGARTAYSGTRGPVRVDAEWLAELVGRRGDAHGEGGTVATDALELVAVGKRFGGVWALSDVSLTVEQGSVHGLIGPNGSGKTTAINVASGLIRPDSGVARLGGRDVTGWPAHRLAQAGVARTFQTVRLFGGLTVLENVMIGGQRHLGAPLAACMLHVPAERAAESEARQAATNLASALGLSGHLDIRADSLPAGLQRRVELARALALKPGLLLLDEPAAGLGEEELEELAVVVRTVGRAGVAILLVEHHVNFVVSTCDRLTALVHGRVLVTGEPSAVIADPHVLEAYLGSPKQPTAAG